MTTRSPQVWPLRLLLTLLCLQLLVARGLAQDSAPEGATRERERAAKAAFDAGVAAAEAGDYTRARSLFLRSRQLVVKASTLLNLAVADLKLGLVDEALFALDALDAPSTGPEHERMLQRARQLRTEAEALRQATEEEKAAARRADENAAAALLAPDPAQLQPSGAANQPGSERDASAQQAHAAPPSSAHSGPALGAPRALLIAGGVLAGGTIGAAIWWAERSRNLETCRNGGEMVCLESGQIERQETAAMALTLTLGVSALSLITGGSVWLVQRKHDSRMTLNVAAWATKGNGGVGVRGVY